MDDGIERRALLLHLGDVLESMSCVAKCSTRFNTLKEAIAEEDSLADFWFLSLLGAETTADDYAKNAASAFFLWPKLLLDATLNRALLANLVQTDMFPGNQVGWDAYVSAVRKEVSWFGEGVGPVAEVDRQMVPWPPTPD